MRIEGSVALVTGGASGLGLAAVRELRDRGARVVIVGRSSTGKEVAEELGPGVHHSPGDVTSEEDIASAIELAETLGPLRIAVSCAGIGNAFRTVGRTGPFPLAAFSKVIQVNLIGTFNVIRLAAARMHEREGDGEERGVIVNTASTAAFDGQIGQAAYAASKGGIVGMTLPIARDLAESGIRVVTIAPGLFRTPMFDGFPASTLDALGQQVPHPARLGEPAEFATLVAHIVENPMLNGETIRLDGALRMAPR
ncbi:short-chain dehydrogenase/reductase family oxidoreductase [Streptomyces himastatinicus ATCC 53653]|uniref:Short-chain dehydrogenase/reductase family oxidoreductase n=1 Tax=Streptomyces himastatinicus ATCC 53653 TaxID=457427 RepID=D9WIU2_9ACTN|nr:3-hydroxyacyl-CoA dehydrogenase [Streptomyces himastatinicus]EFL27595.1 short-chain dehydrogenase/reductase family oxidoreductase [Streptomyces himastatinicus ATCC 53653]